MDRIRPNPRQPRTGFDQAPLDHLAASVKEHGILQPVIVRPIPGSQGFFELVVGERRWRAAVAAGLTSIPAVVRAFSDGASLEAALVENLQREDLNPIERARAYQRISDEFGLTQELIAKRVGRSQSAIANAIRLLSLPNEVLASLESGRITEGHARALLGLQNPGKIIGVWMKVESNSLSVRETEEAVRRENISREIVRPKTTVEYRNDINIIEQNLSHSVGSSVKIVMKGKYSGEIRIGFRDLDGLDALIAMLGGRRQRPQ